MQPDQPINKQAFSKNCLRSSVVCWLRNCQTALARHCEALGRRRKQRKDGDRPRIDRKMLTAQAEKLDKRIHELSAMRDSLRHAAACPHPNHLDCPTFRRLLRGATKAQVSKR